MTQDTILILTASQDKQHVNAVRASLSELGRDSVRIDVDRFGVDWDLSLSFGANENDAIVHTPQGDIELADIVPHSVWFRKPRLAEFGKHYHLSGEASTFIQDEWNSALKGFYRILYAQHVFWVSDPEKILRASYKPYQLHLAHEIGFQLPETLITSNPTRAREFWNKCRGNVVAKAVGRGWVSNERKADQILYVMTNQVTDLDKLEQVRLAPVIFQENICKEYEVRSTVVGRRVFSIKIESQQCDATRIDWRHDFVNVPYSEMRLPESIECKCFEMVRRLGLEYGAIDFIKTPQGEYVFLEINPLGQFQWLEHSTGVPISNAIARLLAGLEPSLVNE